MSQLRRLPYIQMMTQPCDCSDLKKCFETEKLKGAKKPGGLDWRGLFSDRQTKKKKKKRNENDRWLRN